MLAKSPMESSRENSRKVYSFGSSALLTSGLFRYVVKLAIIPYYLLSDCMTGAEIPLHVLTNCQTWPVTHY